MKKIYKKKPILLLEEHRLKIGERKLIRVKKIYNY